jgi:hypothetical protein
VWQIGSSLTLFENDGDADFLPLKNSPKNEKFEIFNLARAIHRFLWSRLTKAGDNFCWRRNLRCNEKT